MAGGAACGCDAVLRGVRALSLHHAHTALQHAVGAFQNALVEVQAVTNDWQQKQQAAALAAQQATQSAQVQSATP